MIVGSLLLILVAVGLLVAGVLGGSNLLIICCIVVVILAAIVLVLGVKQSAAAGLAYGIDIDGEVADELTTEYPAVSGRGFRVRQPDRRLNEDTTPVAAIITRRAARIAAAATAEHGQMVTEEDLGRSIPSQGADPFGDNPPAMQPSAPVGRPQHSAPDDDEAPVRLFDEQPYVEPAAFSKTSGLELPAGYSDTPGYAGEARTEQPYRAAASQDPLTAEDPLGLDQSYDGDLDEDPPDEPSAQIVSPANAARVAMLSTDVLVVDGRPRYHVPGCVHLHGRETEPLPVGEAVELGFTPCALCEPDSALLADARRV